MRFVIAQERSAVRLSAHSPAPSRAAAGTDFAIGEPVPMVLTGVETCKAGDTGRRRARGGWRDGRGMEKRCRGGVPGYVLPPLQPAPSFYPVQAPQQWPITPTSRPVAKAT